MDRLQGKTAVITGGSTGIGFATAQRFVAEGAFVYIFGRRQAELDKAVAVLGPKARGVQGDISQLSDLDRLFARVREERGSIDVLFANAGGGNLAPLGEITPEQYAETFDINVKVTLFRVRKALPLLAATAQGGQLDYAQRLDDRGERYRSVQRVQRVESCAQELRTQLGARS